MKTNVLGSNNEVKIFVDFFDSIPEYDDINHLSNKEFYKKLKKLKEVQKSLCENLRKLNVEKEDTKWFENYKKHGEENPHKERKKKKSSIKPFCATPLPKKQCQDNLFDDDDLSLSDKEFVFKPPSRRSVRIETPSEKPSQDTSPEPFGCSSRNYVSREKESNWNESNPTPIETRSAPNSPLRVIKTNEVCEYIGITIPEPFQMTVRDEENKLVEELFWKINKPEREKPDQFKAHNIPIESQIPLFHKIVADQERRSRMVKEKRKAVLHAQMKPFSFTRRDEEIQELTKKFSKSLPCVYDEEPIKVTKFKAKPIPKNLFSNYIYKKMHEDEFYRMLQKKVRAEEMLKQASLPPSMAKREKCRPKLNVCPRLYKEVSITDKKNASPKCIKTNKNYKYIQQQHERELQELKDEFISSSLRQFAPQSCKRDKKSKRHSHRHSSASSRSSYYDIRTPSSLDLSSVNRSNLAAVLRIQSARNRLEMEMTKKLEEAKLKEEARWREKIMRKKPVFQALAYNHEEDLALRLQLRRDEDRFRNEEHKTRMQLMLGRVNQQPTLFERQSELKLPKTKIVLRRNFDTSDRKHLNRSFSDLSDIKRLTETKDEAIQTIFNRLEETNRESKESETPSRSKKNSVSDEVNI
ncbi:protein FAM161A-like isoform X1 [Cylas formicarius]|uniref:protein FAM161A-like isoform X1 n=1 Tax=Cylas formicarius TaxID=197179 RepID=UPI0029583B7B|nr:protein FAM161A-like isoform X1 [Cylas formicarius]